MFTLSSQTSCTAHTVRHSDFSFQTFCQSQNYAMIDLNVQLVHFINYLPVSSHLHLLI